MTSFTASWEEGINHCLHLFIVESITVFSIERGGVEKE
jgi:hypothetical protein